MKEYLRDAVKEDMDLLFEWANEREVRRNSFSSGKISYEEHQEWFSRILNRPDCRQYIYMQDEEPAGQIRITIDGETAEIGYSICAEKRGMGYGSKILELACKRAVCDFPNVRRLTAKVKPDNTASQKAFLKAGFEEAYYAYEMAVE